MDMQPALSRSAIAIGTLLCLGGAAAGEGAPDAPDRKPGAFRSIAPLHWTVRSDWIDVTRDVSPPARGDGTADDTAALQAGLEKVRDGSTLYLPPGTYRITGTLTLTGPRVGVQIVGAGRDTRIVWDGPEGGVMYRSNGAAYTRYIGLVWDGQGRAGTAVDHRSVKRFETEVTHRNEAFLRCRDYGIRIGWKQRIASAEILYRNCLFEECGTGVAFLSFNDYDNTFDRCEFRRCGTAILDRHGNFYARNCRFIGSRRVDFDILSEHGDSIRRCVSIGSRAFLDCRSIVAPMVVEGCRIAGWQAAEGAVLLRCAPVLMYDCVFENPGAGAGPAVRVKRGNQVLILANVRGPAGPLRPAAPGTARVYSPGSGPDPASPPPLSAQVLDDRPWRDAPVIDVKRDFHAAGDGRTDDTDAVQAAIDAAAARDRPVTVYLPAGRYLVRRTLELRGPRCRIEGGGSGFRTAITWRGPADAPIVHVPGAGTMQIVGLAIGHHDVSRAPRSADILVTGAPGALDLLLDAVFVFGMYQKKPDSGGLVLDALGPEDTVLIEHLQGNIRLRNSSAARFLARTSYEGTVTIEGRSPAGNLRFPGFLTRLSTVADPTLRVRDNGTIVLSDFYVEQALSHVVAGGGSGEGEGRIVLQQPKVQMNSDRPVLRADGYRGLIAFMPAAFYQKPKRMRMILHSAPRCDLLIAGSFWYGAKAVIEQDDVSRKRPPAFLGNHGLADGETKRAERLLLDGIGMLRKLGKMDREFPAPAVP